METLGDARDWPALRTGRRKPAGRGGNRTAIRIKAEFVDLTKMHGAVTVEICFPKLLLQPSLWHRRLESVKPVVRS